MKQIKNKTIAMKYIEQIKGVPIEELLHTLYIEENKSIRDISNELGVHYHTINEWLKKANISMRLPHEKLLEIVEIKRRLKNG